MVLYECCGDKETTMSGLSCEYCLIMGSSDRFILQSIEVYRRLYIKLYCINRVFIRSMSAQVVA